MSITTIIEYLDAYLIRSGRGSIDPVEANALLEREGLLGDSKDRPGKLFGICKVKQIQKRKLF